MEVFEKAQSGDELTHLEFMKFSTHMFAMFIECRLEYYLYHRRPSSNLSFETNNRNNISYLLRSGGRRWWEHQRQWLGGPDDAFVQHVNRELAKHDSERELTA